MVEIAKKDTYALEDIGGGVKVRRRVMAGTKVPDHYEVQGGTETVTEEELAERQATSRKTTVAEHSVGEGKEAKADEAKPATPKREPRRRS